MHAWNCTIDSPPETVYSMGLKIIKVFVFNTFITSLGRVDLVREKMKLLRSGFFYIILFISTIIMGTLAIIGSFIHPKLPRLAAKWWGRMNLCAGGVKVAVKGAEKIDPHQAYILASNHQSWFDIFATLGYIPVPFSWLAKEELFKLPVLGRAMYSAGYIPIDRSDQRKSIISLNKAAEEIRKGSSVFIFPEGTRTPDGTVQGFKKGGFILAAKSHQPIVPISISGSYRILPKGGKYITSGVITITIADPIPTAGMSPDGKSRDLLLHRVRETIRSNLPPEEAGPDSTERQEPEKTARSNGGDAVRNV